MELVAGDLEDRLPLSGLAGSVDQKLREFGRIEPTLKKPDVAGGPSHVETRHQPEYSPWPLAFHDQRLTGWRCP